ncbi:hypothetical protein JCM17846_23510 [Iodidimonas nitroreducens]|uniref:Peptidoglycan binding-like domain-containing protein n=1 Tax=Iodidimonas nitroreducens TaxID=1236968 RepID=A0A5A7NC92_9PROT|nr:peptidoglycan-binding domain-containing protein [Iodidimonas nitroreducens]GAK33425.1 putative peptidoglycan binding domain protein [alpha proteobacterium Q-1]GER04669.1 hypothetical protein JCM17846_23510 [Iodidimonas nitroreducens]
MINTPSKKLPLSLVLSGFLFAATAFGGGAAQAADKDGNLAIKGMGLAKCSAFVESLDARDDRIDAYFGWASGYLTAVNQYETGIYDIVDWQSDGYIAISLKNWCSANADEPFFAAVYAMTKSLKPDAVKTESPLVEIAGASNSMRLYRSTLDRIRERLAELGFHNPSAQGEDDLKSAITRFQAARGLPATGAPDDPTLFMLFKE